MKMKKYILIILTFLVTLISCHVEMLPEGESVNEYIFPYIEFTLSDDGTYYTARVLSGVTVENIYIPSAVEHNGVAISVKYFDGFKNPEDAAKLMTITLQSSSTVITDKAAGEATSFIDIEIDSVEPGSEWGELPIVEKEGMEFLGWFIEGTSEEVKSGDPITEHNRKISPRWSSHKYVHHEGKTPTCTEKGWYEYDTCEHCDYTTYREIPALGHDISVHHDAVEATCTEEGTRDYWECSRCHRFFSDTNPEHGIMETATPAKGHSLSHVEKTEPRCGVKGTLSHWECSVCHRLFSEDDKEKEIRAEDLEIPALEHAWKRTQFSTTATCVWYECELCHETKDAAGHSWNSGETIKKASATKSGRKKYTCSVCGTEKYEDIEPVSTEGHTHEWKVLDRIDATCTNRGYTVMECTLCDTTYRCDYKDPTGHRMTEHPEAKATCTEWGNSKYYSCGDCLKLFKDANGINETTLEEVQEGREPRGRHEWNTSVYLKDGTRHWFKCLHCDETSEKIAHTYTEKDTGTEYLISNATCTSPSLYCYSCVCGSKGTETFTSGEKKPHTSVHHPYKDATCEENGMKEYWSCSECGHNFSDSACTHEIEDISTYVIEAKGHKDSGEFTSAGKDGHQKKCSVCGQGYGIVYEHDIEDWEWTGYDETHHWHKCSECDYKADKDEHHWEDVGEDEVCSDCLYIRAKGEKGQDGSFDIEPGTAEPDGVLKITGEEGSFRATFTLAGKSMMTRVEWYVDDEPVKTVTEISGTRVYFDFNAPDYRTYTVTCVVFNGEIVNSFDGQVFGGELT